MIPARLQWYVLREILRVAFIAAVALTAVVFVGMSLSLMRRGLNILQVYDALPYAAAMSLPYALPCAFLLAVVFVFGRLSGSNEITAMRCSGVNLNAVIFPPLLIALLVCGGMFRLNHYLLPTALNGVRTAGIKVIGKCLQSIPAGSPMKLGKCSVYVGSIDERTRAWRNVAVIEFTSGFPTRVIRADEGSFTMSDGGSAVTLILKGADVYHPRLNKAEQEKPAHFGELHLPIALNMDDEKEQSDQRPKYLTRPQLMKFRADLRRKVAALRKSGAYADVSRPRSSRKRAQKELGASRVEHNNRKSHLLEQQANLGKANSAVNEAQTLVASSQMTRDQLAQQTQEAQARLEDIRKQISELAEQRAQVAQEENPQERLDQIDGESAALTRQAEGMEERLSGAKASLSKAEATLSNAMTKRDEALALREKAQQAEKESTAQAERALAQYTQVRNRWNSLRTWELYLEADSDYESRDAGSLATFLFVLVGIPLGILSRRGNVILALLLSFGTVLAVYYPLAMVGQMLDSDAFLPAYIAEWMPSAVVGFMGLVLMVWGVRR